MIGTTIVGIDLGTTFSAISAVRDSKPFIFPVSGENIMPSVVGVSPEGRWLVGRPALNQWALHPAATVRSIKRKMGTDETVTLAGQTFTPPQISAIILQALKQSAQEQLGEDEQSKLQAVITVPAYFSDAQRQATRDAGAIAGLEVVRILNEPTAAALAYGLQQNVDQVALVYDLGGGTFDVSLVEFSGGVVDVRASHGNTHLGGDDFDERLALWLIGQFESQHGVDLRGDERAFARVRRAAEQAKIRLSHEPFVWVREEYLSQQRGVPLHMEIEVSRAQFISLINDLLVSTVDSIQHVLKDGKINRPDQVLLVGGSTYIPAVWDIVANHTGITPRQDINPSEAVALGAGIQAAIIAGEPIDAILVDVTPFSLGIEVAHVTAWGSLVEDRFKSLIHRNTTIPTVHSEVFTTLWPDQRQAEIKVYQGESLVASQNTLLGEFLFSDLTPEKPGELPRVTVEFDIDVNGILNVHATDRGSGRAAGITVKASRQRLTQSEIQSAQITLPMAHHTANLPDDLLREIETLLARAQSIAAQRPDLPDLSEAIEDMLLALEDDDPEVARDALDNLTDILYDLDDEGGDEGGDEDETEDETAE
jgi:molecular chaperone DnaK